MSKAGSKIIKSAQRALGYVRGENCDGFIVHVPEEVDVKSLRKRKGLTQSEFALRYGFDVRALQDWEQKRRYPDRAARVLLTVIDHEPEAVSMALGNDDFSVVRYNCDGTPDTTFGTGGIMGKDVNKVFDDAGYSVVLQSDGKIIVSGSSLTDFALARYNPDGTLDANFDTSGKVLTNVEGASEVTYGAALQQDGQIIVVGESANAITSTKAISLVRYNGDGSLDLTFGTAGKVITDIGGAVGYSVTVQPVDGKIIVAGSSGKANNFKVIRYYSDGSLDTSFGMQDSSVSGLRTLDSRAVCKDRAAPVKPVLNAGSKIIKSAKKARCYARGEACEGFVVHVPEEVDVKSIRKRKGLTQAEFSLRFGFDVRALQDWEQKHRSPERAARVLLTVIDHDSEAVSRAMAHCPEPSSLLAMA